MRILIILITHNERRRKNIQFRKLKLACLDSYFGHELHNAGKYFQNFGIISYVVCFYALTKITL